MSPALRESLLLICGILLGIVAGAAIVVFSNAPPDVAQEAAPLPPSGEEAAATAVAGGPPAQTTCPIRPLLAARGAQDGQRLPPADVEGRPPEEINGLLLAGKEAAAGGQPRDAEVAYLTACRVADAALGPGSVAAADARYQLGRHYATVAQSQAAVPPAERSGLLRRAQALYADSDRIYRAALGEAHEKTRFAAEGLANTQQALAPTTPAPEQPQAQARAQAAAQPQRAPERPAASAPASRPQAPADTVARAPAAEQPAPAQRRAVPAPRPAEPEREPPRQRAPAREPEPERRPTARAAPPPAEANEPAPVVIEDEDAPPRQATGEARRTRGGDTSVLGAAPESTNAARPSFDCDKVRSVPERLICADPELAQRDRELGRLHARARIVAPDAAAFKRQNDAEWRRREANCRDRECLVAWYEERREQLLDTLADAGR